MIPVARTGFPIHMYHLAHCCSAHPNRAKSTPAYRSLAMWPVEAVGSVERKEEVTLKVVASAEVTAAAAMLGEGRDGGGREGGRR